mmetsp:Transcript_15261/g.31201  ORF Transcript_15261/g.31201 Transcript_15261/m.31201 type:complete len:212 (-) Transcript_15261:198-833(-)
MSQSEQKGTRRAHAVDEPSTVPTGTKRRRLEEKREDAGRAPSAAAVGSDKLACFSNSRSFSTETIASQCRTTTLFIGGLHPRVADAHLQKLFQPYGTVSRVFQVRHKEGPLEGQPRGYAFVEFEAVDSARLAIRRVDGKSLLGRNLLVRPAHERTENGAEGGGVGTATGATSVQSSDPRSIRKARSEVESKIEAVKRAIEEKRRNGPTMRR